MMHSRSEATLSKDLLSLLQKERYVVLSTIDYETKGPCIHAISWVYAPNPDTVYFVIDKKSRLIKNIETQRKLAITVIGEDSTYSIYGDASIQVEQLENVSLSLSLVKVDVTEVRDVMFYGGKILSPPEYEKTYDQRAAEKLDKQVMEAMKKLSLS